MGQENTNLKDGDKILLGRSSNGKIKLKDNSNGGGFLHKWYQWRALMVEKKIGEEQYLIW